MGWMAQYQYKRDKCQFITKVVGYNYCVAESRYSNNYEYRIKSLYTPRVLINRFYHSTFSFLLPPIGAIIIRSYHLPNFLGLA